jgi:hypothetical protein
LRWSLTRFSDSSEESGAILHGWAILCLGAAGFVVRGCPISQPPGAPDAVSLDLEVHKPSPPPLAENNLPPAYNRTREFAARSAGVPGPPRRGLRRWGDCTPSGRRGENRTNIALSSPAFPSAKPGTPPPPPPLISRLLQRHLGRHEEITFL